MKATIQDLDILKNIQPKQVEAYLQSHDWQYNQKLADKASIWTLTNCLGDFEILLPLQPEILDFPRRMSEVLETISLAENRSQLEIISELITQVYNITIQGVVRQIQTPNPEKLSGKITILGVVVDQLRQIQTDLAEQDYILAMKAYQERLPIRCTGDLIKEDNIFILKETRSLTLDNLV